MGSAVCKAKAQLAGPEPVGPLHHVLSLLPRSRSRRRAVIRAEHQTPGAKPFLLSGVFKLPSPLNGHLTPPNSRKGLVCVLVVEQAQNSQTDGCVVAVMSRFRHSAILLEMPIKRTNPTSSTLLRNKIEVCYVSASAEKGAIVELKRA